MLLVHLLCLLLHPLFTQAVSRCISAHTMPLCVGTVAPLWSGKSLCAGDELTWVCFSNLQLVDVQLGYFSFFPAATRACPGSSFAPLCAPMPSLCRCCAPPLVVVVVVSVYRTSILSGPSRRTLFVFIVVLAMFLACSLGGPCVWFTPRHVAWIDTCCSPGTHTFPVVQPMAHLQVRGAFGYVDKLFL